MNKKLTVAVVGATGMVGRTFLKVLEEKKLPVDTYYLFASAKSAGSKVQFMGKEYVIEELTETSFDRGIDIALFSAGGSTSEKFAPIGKAIEDAACPLIKKTEVVDTYEDENGKSITSRITFAHPEKTLTKDEVMDVVNGIIADLEAKGINLKK